MILLIPRDDVLLASSYVDSDVRGADAICTPNPEFYDIWDSGQG